MAKIGAKGGKAISVRKVAALRENAKKAGRPQKLSEQDLQKIVKRHEKGEMLISLAREYNVRPETLSRRLRGKKQPKPKESIFSDWTLYDLSQGMAFLEGLLEMGETAYCLQNPDKIWNERACHRLIKILKEEEYLRYSRF